MAATAEVVRAARDMFAHGFTVVPVREGTKAPAVGKGENWRRPWHEPEVLAALSDNVDFTHRGTAIGFPGGDLNHHIVPLDFDRAAAEAWWRAGCEAAGIDPDDFPTVVTPGKIVDGVRHPGLHRYVHDTRGTLGNRAGKLKDLGLDIRGAGHVMLPPSAHPEGGFYRWVEGRSIYDFDHIPPCPDFIYDAVAKPDPQPEAKAANGAGDVRIHAWCRKALDGERSDLSGIGQGARNEALNSAAFVLGSLAHFGAFSRNEAHGALESACLANGYIRDDGTHAFEATFASGWNAGEDSPRIVDLKDRPRDHGGSREAPRAEAPQGPAPRPLLEPLTAYNPAAELPYVVRGVIAAGQAVTIIGGPGCGKTTLACLLAVCVAAGEPWMGFETMAGPVLYVSAEAPVAAHKRLTAACMELELTPAALPIRIMPQALFLDDFDLVSRVIAEARGFLDAIGKPALSLMVLDTFARCIPGADENSSRDVGIAITTIDRIRAELGCAVVPLHHPSRANPTQGRGSTAMPGGMDGELLVERKAEEADAVGTISPGKPNRDLELFAPVNFRLKSVDLGVDPRDDMVRTVIAVMEGGEPVRRRYLKGQPKILLDALVAAIATHGAPLPGHPRYPQNLTGVRVEDWRAVFYSRYIDEVVEQNGILGDRNSEKTLSPSKVNGARKRAFSRGGQKLMELGYVGIAQPFAWLIKKGDTGT